MVCNTINCLKGLYAEIKADCTTVFGKQNATFLNADLRVYQLAKIKLVAIVCIGIAGSGFAVTLPLFLTGAVLAACLKTGVIACLFIICHDAFVMAKNQQVFFKSGRIGNVDLKDASRQEIIDATTKYVLLKPIYACILPSLIG